MELLTWIFTNVILRLNHTRRNRQTLKTLRSIPQNIKETWNHRSRIAQYNYRSAYESYHYYSSVNNWRSIIFHPPKGARCLKSEALIKLWQSSESSESYNGLTKVLQRSYKGPTKAGTSVRSEDFNRSDWCTRTLHIKPHQPPSLSLVYFSLSESLIHLDLLFKCSSITQSGYNVNFPL